MTSLLAPGPSALHAIPAATRGGVAAGRPSAPRRRLNTRFPSSRGCTEDERSAGLTNLSWNSAQSSLPRTTSSLSTSAAQPIPHRAETVPNQDGTACATAASASNTRFLGRSASWRGKEVAGLSPGRATRGAARASIRAFPVLVTIRARPKLPSLRSLPTFETFSLALARANRDNFRVIHFSVQTDHIHLIVEASSREALIRGLQGLAATHGARLNRFWRRSGKVWNARYHSRALATPREVRNGLVYVLLNFRKHLRVATGTDPRSSALWFERWRRRRRRQTGPCPVAQPRTWLRSRRLAATRGGPIDPARKAPEGARERRRPQAEGRGANRNEAAHSGRKMSGRAFFLRTSRRSTPPSFTAPALMKCVVPPHTRRCWSPGSCFRRSCSTPGALAGSGPRPRRSSSSPRRRSRWRRAAGCSSRCCR